VFHCSGFLSAAQDPGLIFFFFFFFFFFFYLLIAGVSWFRSSPCSADLHALRAGSAMRCAATLSVVAFNRLQHDDGALHCLSLVGIVLPGIAGGLASNQCSRSMNSAQMGAQRVGAVHPDDLYRRSGQISPAPSSGGPLSRFFKLTIEATCPMCGSSISADIHLRGDVCPETE